jgi:hypothetical protein
MGIRVDITAECCLINGSMGLYHPIYWGFEPGNPFSTSKYKGTTKGLNTAQTILMGF